MTSCKPVTSSKKRSKEVIKRSRYGRQRGRNKKELKEERKSMPDLNLCPMCSPNLCEAEVW